jgi:gamma-butyrobetaine dioxygenase
VRSTPDPVQVIADLFASAGAREHRSEPVTQASHMLQAAALARASGAPAPLVAAALLHDVGHFTPPVSGRDPVRGARYRHSDTGADWLARWFGDEVTVPVRLHVAAKRYLCAVEPGYLAALSPPSLCTLELQGGPMGSAERAGFEARPQACAALRLRRWDDAAKDPAATPPAFGYYRALLRRLLRPRPASVP